METLSLSNPQMTTDESSDFGYHRTMLSPSLMLNIEGVTYHHNYNQGHNVLYRAHNQLLPTDILLGKDKAIFNHVGNKNFRAIIQDNLSEYIAAPSKSYKSKLIRQVHNRIILMGYRFLKRATTLNSNKELLWQEIEYHEARDKVSHALRDKVRELTKQQRRERKQQNVRLKQQQHESSSGLRMTVTNNDELNKKIPQVDKVQCRKQEDTLERPSKKQKISSSSTTAASILTVSQPSKNVNDPSTIASTTKHIHETKQILEKAQAGRRDDCQKLPSLGDEKQPEYNTTINKSVQHASQTIKLFPSKLPLLSSVRKVSVTREDEIKGNASIKEEEDDGILSLVRRKLANEVLPIISPIPKDDHDDHDLQSKTKRRYSMSSLTSLFSDCTDTIPPSYYNKNIRVPVATRRCSILSSISFDSYSWQDDCVKEDEEAPIGSFSADRRFSMTSITCWEEEGESFSDPEDPDFSSATTKEGKENDDNGNSLSNRIDSEIDLFQFIDQL